VNRVPLLPHAAPFLLLDQVLEVEARRGAFLKLVSAADPCVDAQGLLPAAFVLDVGCGDHLDGRMDGANPLDLVRSGGEWKRQANHASHAG